MYIHACTLVFAHTQSNLSLVGSGKHRGDVRHFSDPGCKKMHYTTHSKDLVTVPTVLN